MNEPVIDSLRRAVAASPDDVELRVHLASLLVNAGLVADAVAEAAEALRREPAHEGARAVMATALGPDSSPAAPEPAVAFDWTLAEDEVAELAPPMFVSGESGRASNAFLDVARETITLADVGGMVNAKERLNAAFLAPLQNPELRALYGKSLRGGLLMYGPPGCGKTYLARAMAGELGANFISVGLPDILDAYLGASEQNLAAAFELARASAPVVLFFDELDTLGQRRSQMTGTMMRGVVNQFLTELDGVASDNEGVFILGATNQPWDIDPAFRRPGRFDRTVLVLPPDEEARRVIFANNLSRRPVESIDLELLARSTDGYSGADITYVCEAAAERALLDSVRTGTVRMIGMADLTGALEEVKPSTGEWLSVARNVVLFGTDDGTYTELRDYLKKRKRL